MPPALPASSLPTFPSSSLAAEARELAARLRLCPEGRLRAQATERQWRYRPYQGGEPVVTIDWRQSARTRELMVRSHEPLASHSVLFWTSVGRALPHVRDNAGLLFLALARLLSAQERTVGWLGLERGQTTTAAALDEIFSAGFAQSSTETAPRLTGQHGSILVLAIDFSAATRALYDALRTFDAQGNRCVLIDLGGEGRDSPSILARKNWSIFALPEKPDWAAFLPPLFQELVMASR